jgi:beta-lactam-binding protein with PASTA domain
MVRASARWEQCRQMARARDKPPDVPPEDDRTRELPPEEPTEPISPRDPRTRQYPVPGDPYAREEVYEELPPPEEPRSWWRENLWVWLLVLLIVVLGGIALLWFLQRDGGPEDRRIVPGVVGMTQADAIRAVLSADLEPVVNRNESPRPEGEVYSQAPGGGSRLREGEPVVINVSTGPPTTTTVTTTTTETTTVEQPPPPAPATVPDVVGQNQVDAGEVLEGNGLVADSYPVPSGEPAGTVISQNPAPGTELKEGDTVRINVALGPEERQASEIPDVTGLEAGEARQRARVEGFTVRTLYRRPPSREELGEALTQSPAAGTSAPILTQITIYVGR